VCTVGKARMIRRSLTVPVARYKNTLNLAASRTSLPDSTVDGMPFGAPHDLES
jgi:hypothetical protein